MSNKTEIYKRLADYIRPVDVRNKDLKVERLLGVSISKQFMPSIANTIGTDMRNYKVVRDNQFAYGPVTSRNGDKVSVALLKGEDAIISQAYTVFEIIDIEQLSADYLMMWFRRPEFDRYARFHSHGSAREVFDWKEMCDVMLPVPPIHRQRELVAQYEALSRRICINEQMIATLEETAQALYRKMFVEGIDKENLPEGWRMGTLGEVAEYVSEKQKISSLTSKDYISAENMIKNMGGIAECVSFPECGNCTAFKPNDILLSNIRPYFKKMWLATKSGGCSNDVLNIRAKDILSPAYVYYSLANDVFFDYVTAGSNGVKMPRGDKNWIMDFPIVISNTKANNQFAIKHKKATTLIEIYNSQSTTLRSLQSLLLTKLSSL